MAKKENACVPVCVCLHTENKKNQKNIKHNFIPIFNKTC